MFPESKVGGYEGYVMLIKGGSSSLVGNRFIFGEETCTTTTTVIPIIIATDAIFSHFGDFFRNKSNSSCG
jgi:hypothetical protein